MEKAPGADVFPKESALASAANGEHFFLSFGSLVDFGILTIVEKNAVNLEDFQSGSVNKKEIIQDSMGN